MLLESFDFFYFRSAILGEKDGYTKTAFLFQEWGFEKDVPTVMFFISILVKIWVGIVDIWLGSGSILYTVYIIEGALVDGLYGVKNGGRNRQKRPKMPKIDVSPYIFTGV